MPPKIDTFRKEDTSIRKLNISIENNIFENGDHLLQK